MVHQVNAAGTIDPARGMHYRFHRRVDPSIYPQVHDFYEITLLTGGCMEVRVEGWSARLHKGSLILVRPGDPHTRAAEGPCTYINLAFPARVITDLFTYLGDPEGERELRRADAPPLAVLTPGETLLLQTRLERLNLLPAGDPRTAAMALRQMVFQIVTQYLRPAPAPARAMTSPPWLEELLKRLDAPENFDWGLPEMVAYSGRTKEHLCRSFKKYLGVTPTAYLNAHRLNYAANLLRHSDQKVVDIVYAAGFQSLSRFYQAFRQAYGLSPRQYRGRGKE